MLPGCRVGGDRPQHTNTCDDNVYLDLYLSLYLRFMVWRARIAYIGFTFSMIL